MEYTKISNKVRQVIDNSKNSYLEIVEGKGNINVQPILFNQRETLRKINFYINNKYTERDDDAIFWNISNPRITHFAKLISPDTKDFYPYGLGQHNFLQAWALRKNVRKWFNDEAFYKTLNDVSEGLSTYGSTVWKKYKEGGKMCVKESRTDNLYFDQAIENIEDTDIVELHDLTEHDLWEKDGAWENVLEVFKKNLQISFQLHKICKRLFKGFFISNSIAKTFLLIKINIK